MKNRLLLPLAFLFAQGLSAADPAPAPAYPPHVLGNTQVRDLPRSANGRDYRLYIALPYSYAANPTKRYPVLYICDGQYDFTLINGFVGNLLFDRVIPEFILVGFSYPGTHADYNPLRFFDYMAVPDPLGDPEGRKTGHATEFLSVVEKEFIPLIEREYRVDPSYRVLGGSSAGGHFALYAMLARPGLFQAIIAPSPAADWGNDWLFRFEEEFHRSGRPLPVRLFMSGAELEWPQFLDGIKRFHARLASRSYEGFVYQWRLVDGERHAGTKAESYNRGIRFAFAPLAPKD